MPNVHTGVLFKFLEGRSATHVCEGIKNLGTDFGIIVSEMVMKGREFALSGNYLQFIAG